MVSIVAGSVEVTTTTVEIQGPLSSETSRSPMYVAVCPSLDFGSSLKLKPSVVSRSNLVQGGWVQITESKVKRTFRPFLVRCGFGHSHQLQNQVRVECEYHATEDEADGCCHLSINHTAH
jgi:hypothetical protein